MKIKYISIMMFVLMGVFACAESSTSDDSSKMIRVQNYTLGTHIGVFKKEPPCKNMVDANNSDHISVLFCPSKYEDKIFYFDDKKNLFAILIKKSPPFDKSWEKVTLEIESRYGAPDANGALNTSLATIKGKCWGKACITKKHEQESVVIFSNKYKNSNGKVLIVNSFEGITSNGSYIQTKLIDLDTFYNSSYNTDYDLEILLTLKEL